MCPNVLIRRRRDSPGSAEAALDVVRGARAGGGLSLEEAAEEGFYDQSHSTRHFKRVVGTTPGRFALSSASR